MAESAGCDMSQNDVVMNETIFDYHMYPGEPIGFATLEEAVLSMDRLAEGRDRAELSTATLRAATAAAVAEGLDSNQFEVRLPGAALSVTRFHDGTYRATGLIECA